MPTKITIREAAKLRSNIENALRDLRVEMTDTSVSVNLFDPDVIVMEQINDLPRKVETRWAQYQSLAGVLLNVRTAIDEANHTRVDGAPSVSDLLAKIANLKLQADGLLYFKSATARLTDEQLNARLTGRRDMLSGEQIDSAVDLPYNTVRGRRTRRLPAHPLVPQADAAIFNALSAKDIDAFKAIDKRLHKDAEKLHAQVEKLNNSITLTISEDVIAVLAAHDIEV